MNKNRHNDRHNQQLRGEDLEDKYRRSQRRIGIWLNWISGSAALVGLLGLLYLYATLKATQEAAHAASDASKTASEAMLLDQWPYLWASKVELTAPVSTQEMQVNITFKNIGKSPAYSVRSYKKFGLIPLTGRDEDAEAQEESLFQSAKIAIDPSNGMTIPPSEDYFTTTQEPLKLTKDEVERITLGKLELVAVAGATYKDVFGNERETEICRVIVGKYLSVWHYCAIHNTMR